MAWSCIRLVSMMSSDLHRDCCTGALGHANPWADSLLTEYLCQALNVQDGWATHFLLQRLGRDVRVPPIVKEPHRLAQYIILDRVE
jgi:hypothetical protein